jgi:hypothetical protein
MARAALNAQPETHLRNAQEELREEHVEIALYSRIETFAQEVGDRDTATLVKTIRRDEERMAKYLGVYTIVKPAADTGWASARTLSFAGVCVALLAAFLVRERLQARLADRDRARLPGDRRRRRRVASARGRRPCRRGRARRARTRADCGVLRKRMRAAPPGRMYRRP